MQWGDLASAIALVLVIEGLIPFISPDAMRRWTSMIQKMNDQNLRFIGLTSIVLGLLLLNFVR